MDHDSFVEIRTHLCEAAKSRQAAEALYRIGRHVQAVPLLRASATHHLQALACAGDVDLPTGASFETWHAALARTLPPRGAIEVRNAARRLDRMDGSGDGWAGDSAGSCAYLEAYAALQSLSACVEASLPLGTPLWAARSATLHGGDAGQAARVSPAG